MTIYWGKPIPAWIIFFLMVAISVAGVLVPPDMLLESSKCEMQLVSSEDEVSPLDVDLPYRRYKAIEDSIKRAKWEESYFVQNTSSSTTYFLGLGLMQGLKGKGKKDYHLMLDGYRLPLFVEVDNKASGTIIYFPVWDKIDSTKRSGHLEKKKINIRYQLKKSEKKYPYEGNVLVPVSPTTGTILNFVLWGLILVAFAVTIYTVVYMPFKLLYNLSKGRAFANENIGMLYFMGWVFIAAAVTQPAIQICFHLLFSNQIPEQIQFIWYKAIMSSWKICVLGLGILLLAKTFVHGMEIQEEQQLTV